ncbi:Protein of unknown function (DUF3049 [Striga hermonthica]|uniref:FAF domain-containing protein n=1 Tax=Striga hermonthica TaxID=68872 RepID=A0A9N7P0W0_STRHE|nr:Protein of unknown function (DUF3049 [Striga hermonthica]
MANCGGQEQHMNLDSSLCQKSPCEKQISPTNTFDMETFSQINHLRTFSGSTFPLPTSSRSTDTNAIRDGFSLPPQHHIPNGHKKQYRHSDSFSSVNSDNHSTCTEGLGLESFNDVDEFFKNEIFSRDNNNTRNRKLRETRGLTRNELKRSRSCGMGELPPPISCIGKCGKPFVSFKSFRQDGRFVLKEIRIPELLHVCRENGRLKLQFIQSDDDDDDDDAIDGATQHSRADDVAQRSRTLISTPVCPVYSQLTPSASAQCTAAPQLRASAPLPADDALLPTAPSSCHNRPRLPPRPSQYQQPATHQRAPASEIAPARPACVLSQPSRGSALCAPEQ